MTSDPAHTVRITRRFDASADRVFDAWLDPQRAGKWLFATPTGKMVRAEIDPRVGGSFIFTDRRDNQDIEHTGTYLEIDRPRRLVFQFAVPKYSKLFTRVSIDIKPLGSGCELTLVHEGVLPEYLERTQQGWGKILSAMAANVDPNAAYGVVTAPGTIRFERLLPGPIERVWSYLTDSDKRGKWFAGGKIDPHVGGAIELRFDHDSLSSEIIEPPEQFKEFAGKPGPIYHQRITRYEPPKILSWEWDGSGSDRPSEVNFELTPHGEKVLLVLTHRNLSAKHMPGVAGGWHTHLQILAERLSGREPHSIWRYLDEIEGWYERRLTPE